MNTRLKLAAVALAALCLQQGAAVSGEASGWIKTPSRGDVDAAFPDKAIAAQVSGKATLNCTITPQGVLTECTVTDESPRGYDFGAAALNLVSMYQATPAPVARKTTIPLVFETQKSDYAEQLKADFRAQGVDVQKLIQDLEWNDLARLNDLRQRGIDPEQLKQALGIMPTRGQQVTRLWSAPTWIAVPNWADIQAAHPRMSNAAEGSAAIQCNVQPDGFLRACQILNETPRSNGFGSAALNLSKKFQARLPEPNANLAVQISIPIKKAGAPAAPLVITQPAWTSVPSPAAMAAVFPQGARNAGLQVVNAPVRCTVGDAGKLTGCAYTGPPNPDLAQAALRLTDLYTISPWAQGIGPSQGATVNAVLRITAGS